MVKDTKIQTVVSVAVGILIIFSLLVALYPTMTSSGDSLNASNQCISQGGDVYNSSGCFLNNVTLTGYSTFPLATLFAGGGIVFILLAVLVFFVIVKNKVAK